MNEDYTWHELVPDRRSVQRTIKVTELHDFWIKARVECGGFTDDSDYISELIRRDQETIRTFGF